MADGALSNSDILDLLSPQAREALLQHLAEKDREESLSSSSASPNGPPVATADPATDEISENFGMSQFWYTDESSEILAQECLSLGGFLPDSDTTTPRKIACLCCPSVYRALKRILARTPHQAVTCHIFEYDRRFSRYGPDYIYYDYSFPLEFPKEFLTAHKKSYDFLCIDPPYLSEECLEKVTMTIKILGKTNPLYSGKDTRLLYNTGAILKKSIEFHLNARPQRVFPRHSSHLMNEFKSYTNYVSKRLEGNEEETGEEEKKPAAS